MVKGINFNNYRTIMSRLGRNIRNTYVFSIIAIVFIIIIGILVSYILVRKKGKVANLIDTLIMFPYVIPGSVLGIGLIVAFNRKPIILVGTAAIMIISYIIRKLPYTVRSGGAFLYQMDPFIEEASINLGVSPMKTFFTVTARMMLCRASCRSRAQLDHLHQRAVQFHHALLRQDLDHCRCDLSGGRPHERWHRRRACDYPHAHDDNLACDRVPRHKGQGEDSLMIKTSFLTWAMSC